MLYRRLLLVCFYLIARVLAVPGQQQDLNFTSITSKDGLSSNTVNAILKDKYGLVWFGTEDGLDRFDGVNIKVYRHKPGRPETLDANEILSLHEDKDGNLWVGTSGGSVSRYDREHDEFINFPSNGTDAGIRNNIVLSVCTDYTGKLWVANYEGVDILDPSTRQVRKFPQNPNQLGPSFLKGTNILFEDSKHQMWIGTDHGLYHYSPADRSVKKVYHGDNEPVGLSTDGVNAIAEDERGNLWIGTNNGLKILPNGSSVLLSHNQFNSKGYINKRINAISISAGILWIGTNEGLNLYNITTNQISAYRQNFRNLHSLTAYSVRCIYIDNQGIYWLGTTGGGVDKYDRNLNLFNYVQSNIFDDDGLHSSIVTSFSEANNGIYVGTQGDGLSLFSPETKLFRHFNLKTRRKSSDGFLSIMGLKMNTRNQLFIGTYADGLFVFDPASAKYEQLLKGNNFDDLNSNDIFCFKEDDNGNMWIGTNGSGINVLNAKNKVIKKYTPNPKFANDVKLPINGFIRAFEEDGNGNIWIATHGGGVAVLQPSSEKFSVYTSSNSNLSNDKVLSLLRDSHGNMWAGTFGGGIALFNKATKKFISYSEKEGLQNNNVYKLLEDKNGLIWASTNNGISSIDPTTKKIKNYNYHNGVQNNNFVYGSGLSLSNGDLYFGGLEGFNYFNPANLKKNTNQPIVLITDLKIANQPVSPSKDGPIKQNISFAQKIDLNYKQNFTLSFIGVSYTSPEQNQYAYKLEGFEKNWNYVGNITTASYTNLDPGRYVFHVKASNNDGIWNPESTSIEIYVHPPFWRTVYAYIFYVLLVVGFVFYLRHRGIQKLKKKFALTQQKLQAEQKQKEIERVHELDQLKIKFLTNLSHEFRTPISLILGPIENLLLKEKNERSVGQLYMIKRNARRLLNLVNQLLDFRKMEEHELTLHASEGDLVAFIKDICDSFADLSERKKIDFACSSQFKHLHTRFDHEKLERILFNVLSNAFKFTLPGGLVRVELERQENYVNGASGVNIKVSDTGIGISEDKKDKIFERFFQTETATAVLNQGTGIGLSIAREFVKMHGGTIDVDSTPGMGTTFNIRLPLVELKEQATEEAALETVPDTGDDENEGMQQEQDVFIPGSTDKPSVLLVEDNDDFRYYLQDNLKQHYKVYEASNGKEGWQTALSRHPSLVVSDISMPYMDGIELSRKIKADKRTSHIPVILLTALTGEEDQIKGLETGATDYITKPFNFEVLNAKIKNLMELNDMFKSTYSRQIKVVTPEVQVESADEKLLQEVMQYIENNLTDTQLSVENLSRHVGMSRSSLYSKLLELTGQTPVEYIRTIKLDKAAVLLEKSDMNIAQIAYSVGFATPNYFTKAFKAKFNLLPSKYAIKMKAKQQNLDAS